MASLSNSISLLIILLIITPGISPSFAHTPPSYGAGSGSETVPPAGTGTVPPSGSGTSPPAGAGTVPPSGSGTAPPARAGTVPPSGSGTTPPTGAGTVPPSGSGTVPPSGSGMAPPTGAGTVPSSGSGTTPPAGAGTVPPSGSGTAPPVGAGTVPPSGSGTTPPVGAGTVPPSGSGMTPPSGIAPPIGAGTVPPSGSGTVPPAGLGAVPGVGAALPGLGAVLPGLGVAVPGLGAPLPGLGAVVPGLGAAVPGQGAGVVPGYGAGTGFVPSGSFVTTIQTAMQEIQKMIPIVSKFNTAFGGNLRVSSAVRDCLDLFDLSSDELSWSTISCNSSTYGQAGALNRQFDLQTWLSAALSNQVTCKESLTASGSILGSMMSTGLEAVTTYMSQCLSMVSKAAGTTAGISGRKLVQGFPEWTESKDRKLLQAASKGVTPDAVVAQDGSGKYKTITDAINAAPDSSTKKFVIYVKKGVYKEYVEVPKKKWNIMLIGDGMGVTIITGNRNVVDGWTTYRSATVAVNGRSFIARDLTVQNTAGPAKHQAVALRSDSDLSVFYRCGFEGYQDTLYAHALRQFYRECKITGTIDFIFGDAAAVFQDCQLLARQALPNQQNIFTAHGRKDPNQNTGFSFQFCKIDADTDLAKAPNPTPTYLGRPWKEYARTIVMQSYIGKVIQPQGWLEWNGNIGLNTLYYAEFNNTGPGAAVANRVKWPGYHVLTRPHQATNFTVGHFINGNIWLPKTGVAFTSGFRTFRN